MEKLSKLSTMAASFAGLSANVIYGKGIFEKSIKTLSELEELSEYGIDADRAYNFYQYIKTTPFSYSSAISTILSFLRIKRYQASFQQKQFLPLVEWDYIVSIYKQADSTTISLIQTYI